MIEACLAPVLIEGTPGGLDFLSGRRGFSDADGGLVGQTILGVTRLVTLRLLTVARPRFPQSARMLGMSPFSVLVPWESEFHRR